jgi:hypothetical protein
MRYRALDRSGDYQLGKFLVDSPSVVAQAVQTRLGLWIGEWFLDLAEGTDYGGRVLGHGNNSTRDMEIQKRILTTQGVDRILTYSSSFDPRTRTLTVNASLNTVFGPTAISVEAR